ncbi:MAG: hypothetical protein GY749_10700 [Desulfobacteraceae bacterium]|nr:hypothetical protein [Desulfobacteraceae bacterium]
MACPDYPPAYYKTDKGEVKGYLYDIAFEALNKRMGIPVGYHILSLEEMPNAA